jgi:hypothetical protein
MSAQTSILVAAMATIVSYTFLWKTNKAYRLAEHIFLALGAGHAVVMGVNNIRTIVWNPIFQKGQVILIIPLILGLLLYARFFKSFAWLARIPTAVIIGSATAIAVRGTIQAQLLQQIAASAEGILTLNGFLVFFGTLVTIVYFTYTYKMTGPVAGAALAGRWVMMIGFGAAFGASVMGRLSLVVGRFQFLLGDWLHLMH